MRKVFTIALICGFTEAIIIFLLPDTKSIFRLALVAFLLYMIAYIILAELERYLPE